MDSNTSTASTTSCGDIVPIVPRSNSPPPCDNGGFAVFGGRFCHKEPLEVDLPANPPDGDQPAPVTVANTNGNSQPLFWLYARNASSTKVKCRLRDAACDEDVASFDHAPGCCAGTAFRLYTGGRCQSSSRVGGGKLAILRGEECIKIQLRGLPYVGINVSGDFAERTFSIMQHMPGRRSERLLASVAPGPAGVRVRINPGVDAAFAVAVVAFTCVAGSHKSAAGAVGCRRSSSLSGCSSVASSDSGCDIPTLAQSVVSLPASQPSSPGSPASILALSSPPASPCPPKPAKQPRQQQHQKQQQQLRQQPKRPEAMQLLHAKQQLAQAQAELQAQRHSASLEASLQALSLGRGLVGTNPLAPSQFSAAAMQLGSCLPAALVPEGAPSVPPLMLQQLQQRECHLQEQLRVLQQLQLQQALKEQEFQQQLVQQQLVHQQIQQQHLSWMSGAAVDLHPFLWGPKQEAASAWACV